MQTLYCLSFFATIECHLSHCRSGFTLDYMLLAFNNPKIAQTTTKAKSIINYEEECRLKKDTGCLNPSKLGGALYSSIYVYVLCVYVCMYTHMHAQTYVLYILGEKGGGEQNTTI